MQPVLLSTFMFIPNGQTDLITIRFYLSDHPGIWDVDTNNVYLTQQLWNEWRNCKNDQHLQKLFFNRLNRVSNALLK